MEENSADEAAASADPWYDTYTHTAMSATLPIEDD